MKPGKQAGTSYFTEQVKLVGMVPEGIQLPEAPEGTLYGVNLYAQNDPEAVKQLRVCIKNHIKRANNYEGSILKGELEGSESGNASSEATPAAKPQGIAPKAAPAAEDDDFDDDVPF